MSKNRFIVWANEMNRKYNVKVSRAYDDLHYTLSSGYSLFDATVDLENVYRKEANRKIESNYKTEIERLENKVSELEYEIIGIMHFVNKWLTQEEIELNKTNVLRADFVREKVLKLIEEKEDEIEIKERFYKYKKESE